MANMMMNQASDRDERHEEREERRQEFRIQMEMQRQQMQQQQNMMAMIMMAMLGWNDGSLSLPNNGIIQNVTAAAWLGIPSGIPENSGEFPIPDPFSTQFFPIPIPVPIGLRVPAKF